MTTEAMTTTELSLVCCSLNSERAKKEAIDIRIQNGKAFNASHTAQVALIFFHVFVNFRLFGVHY